MTQKLDELKSRAINLNYKDDKELDDIIRKTKMYVEKLFPTKFTYSPEIDSIKFKPSFFVSGMGEQPYRDSWLKGQQELINFLDTRIEEIKLEQVEKPQKKLKPQVIEKIVTVQDNNRIDQLTQENNALRKSKSLWNRINWGILIPILLTIVGGAYYFGYQNGKSQFDLEKLELFEANKKYVFQIDSIKHELVSSNTKIQELINLIPEDFSKTSQFPLDVLISFLSPTPIFEGEILITAKDNYEDHAILDFKGIKGLSENVNGKFENLEIEVKQGDRFYFKSEKDNIYSVNVISSSVDVDLEIIEKK